MVISRFLHGNISVFNTTILKEQNVNAVMPRSGESI